MTLKFGPRALGASRRNEVRKASAVDRARLAQHHARCFIDEQLPRILHSLVNDRVTDCTGAVLDKNALARECLSLGVSLPILRLGPAFAAHGDAELTAKVNKWRKSYVATMQGLKSDGFDLRARRIIAKQLAPSMLAEMFDLVLPIANSTGLKPSHQDECISLLDQLGVGTAYGWNEQWHVAVA